MTYSRKNILIAIILAILLLGVGYYCFAYSKKPIVNSDHSDQNTFDEIAFHQHPRQYLLNYISQTPLTEYDAKFSYGDDFTANGEKIYALYYLPDSSDTVEKQLKKESNHPEDTNSPYRGGIVAFVKKNNSYSIVWESKENLFALVGDIKFKDIDNDGTDELVLTAGQGAQLVPALWIYKWDGQKFNLINPNPQTTNDQDRWMAGYSADLTDVDGDKTFEVVTTNEVDGKMVQRIYKFNGKNYSLFKESTI